MTLTPISVDRDESLLQQVVKESNSGNIAYFVADLRDSAAISACSSFALRHLGHIDVALFNAGICGANSTGACFAADGGILAALP